MSEPSLPLSHIHALESWFLDISIQRSIETSSNVGYENWFESSFCRSSAIDRRQTSQFGRGANRMRPSSRHYMTTSYPWRRNSLPTGLACNCDAYCARTDGARVSGSAIAAASVFVPLLSKLFRVRH
jgi:hypothetical protein